MGRGDDAIRLLRKGRTIWEWWCTRPDFAGQGAGRWSVGFLFQLMIGGEADIEYIMAGRTDQQPFGHPFGFQKR